MQLTVLNRATMRVADTTGVSGRLTADEVNLNRLHNRICKGCALAVATLILPALAVGFAVPTFAQQKDALAAEKWLTCNAGESVLARQCPTHAKPERPSSKILIRGKFSS
jgi:hypothetical protein